MITIITASEGIELFLHNLSPVSNRLPLLVTILSIKCNRKQSVLVSNWQSIVSDFGFWEMKSTPLS